MALLMAAVAISFVAVFTVDFATNSKVEWAAATNARDEMRAHFMARSGMNLAELIIRVQTDVFDKNRKLMGDMQIADFMPMFMGAFGGSKEEVESFGELLGVRADDLKGLGTEIGTFDVEIVTEDGKINVNCARGSQAIKKALKSKLEALVYFELYNPVFENEDAEGYRRDRAEQVSAILDYIDTDKSKGASRGAAEDYGYQSLKDRYKAKNEAIDSVGELKLVRGIDDRFWTLFGDQFTAYGSCKENLAAVEDPKLIAAIIFLSAKNEDDPVIINPAKLWALAAIVAQARQWGVFFDKTADFISFVKDPTGYLAAQLAQAGIDQPASQIPIEGVVLDKTKLEQIAELGARKTYRVKAQATIDTLVKTIEGVWDTTTTNQNPRGPDYRNGAWVFWREE